MDYQAFKKRVRHLPLLRSADLSRLERDPQVIRNQLTRWRVKKLLLKLRKGVYLLNSDDRAITPSRAFLAAQLYTPSYISLEYALNFYGLIPEAVFAVTSITTRKTMRFSNPEGEFTYQHIQPGAFRGFRVLKDDAGLPYFIAESEKAVVDFLYFNFRKKSTDRIARFRDSYRFQHVNQLKPRKIMRYAGLFHNAAVSAAAGEFCAFIREERKR
ncbi:MAG: hypothetical protein Q8N85_01690 [Candidatus Omnitrophota bacterium]|nr:hypothetical protein [Candidatus Omnitrophota bacterium]